MKIKTDIPPREIAERLQAGEMSRRQFHQVLAAAGIAMVATPLVSRPALAAAADQGNYFTWGGYDIPELFAPYIEKHGEAPNFAAFGGAEEALTKLMGGFVVDVAHPCNADLPRWMASGLFRPIEVERLSNWGGRRTGSEESPGRGAGRRYLLRALGLGADFHHLPRGSLRPSGRR